MRILIVSNAYLPSISGVVTSIALMRQALIRAGHEVFIFAPRYKKFHDTEPGIYRFPAIDLTKQFELSLAIPLKPLMKRTMYEIMPDIIHSQHPVVMGSLAASFACELDIPLVFTYHTRYAEYAQHYLHTTSGLVKAVANRIVSKYLQHCNHIIAPTPSIRSLILEQHKPLSPVSVIPTPVDFSDYDKPAPYPVRTRLGLDPACELLLYFGRFSDEKNLDFLLRAFVQIHHSRPLTRLVLLGRGPIEPALRRMAKQLGISEQVIFPGAIPHAEVPHYARAADCFVFPSLTDTQGLVLIESMAAGTPVVAVDSPSSMDILGEGGGILTPPEEGEFAQAVIGLLQDRPQLLRLGNIARQIVQRYNITTTGSKLVEVYRQALLPKENNTPENRSDRQKQPPNPAGTTQA
ncbi:MAG: glycosyltransferase [Anaerolineaceae bacterium]|nr:glycosyltransferase [Anaerolineaceae bacterium]